MLRGRQGTELPAQAGAYVNMAVKKTGPINPPPEIASEMVTFFLWLLL
jgi:hypothetical protein